MKCNMTFWDIDSYQGLEIRTPGRVTWAGLKNASAAKDDTALGFNMPADRLPSGSVKDNTVYCSVKSYTGIFDPISIIRIVDFTGRYEQIKH